MSIDTPFNRRRMMAWLAATVVVVVLAGLAPHALLDPPETTGRAGLARWRAWAVGELPVTDDHAQALYDGFVVSTRPDGATVLGSMGTDGACYRLVVTDGVPVGPSLDTTGQACTEAAEDTEEPTEPTEPGTEPAGTDPGGEQERRSRS